MNYLAYILFIFLVSLNLDATDSVQKTISTVENLSAQMSLIGLPPLNNPCAKENEKCQDQSSWLKPEEEKFYEFPSGSYLKLKTSGKENIIATGTGSSYGPVQIKRYCELKAQNPKNDIQWYFQNLTDQELVHKSINPTKQYYGASLSKVFTAGAYLHYKKGELTLKERQLLNDLIVKSSNDAWTYFQKALGDGNDDLGKKRTQNFLNQLGITRSIGYRNTLGGVHGNEINAQDVARFIQGTYNKRFFAATDLFKVMFLSTTGAERAKKYLPTDLVVGSKTGTYDGGTSVNGRQFTSHSKHQTIVFNLNDKAYSLSLLSEKMSNEDIGILVAGLVREYTGLDGMVPKKVCP